MSDINILMTGFAKRSGPIDSEDSEVDEEFVLYLAKLYELKREGVINNVFIEKNDSWEMEIVDGFDFGIVECDSPELIKSAPNYFNDIAKVKSNKKGECLTATGFPFFKSYIIYSRMDVRLDVDLIREYAGWNKPMKDKIWVSNYELFKPFYINDLTYFAPANTFASLIAYREYARWNHGISHIREFINPFLEIPVFKNYIAETDGVFASDTWWELNGRAWVAGPYSRRDLLATYYAVLKKHFNVFGHRFRWDDDGNNMVGKEKEIAEEKGFENREGLYFDKSYTYDTERTLDENARANTKYDKTFYIYDDVDYTEHLDTIR